MAIVIDINCYQLCFFLLALCYTVTKFSIVEWTKQSVQLAWRQQWLLNVAKFENEASVTMCFYFKLRHARSPSPTCILYSNSVREVWRGAVSLALFYLKYTPLLPTLFFMDIRHKTPGLLNNCWDLILSDFILMRSDLI